MSLTLHHEMSSSIRALGHNRQNYNHRHKTSNAESKGPPIIFAVVGVFFFVLPLLVFALRKCNRNNQQEDVAKQEDESPEKRQAMIDSCLDFKVLSFTEVYPDSENTEHDDEEQGGCDFASLADDTTTDPNDESKTSFSLEETTMASSCPICLQCFQQGEHVCFSNVSKCHHYFHQKCIVEWLKTHNDCPYCRATFLSMDHVELHEK